MNGSETRVQTKPALLAGGALVIHKIWSASGQTPEAEIPAQGGLSSLHMTQVFVPDDFICSFLPFPSIWPH